MWINLRLNWSHKNKQSSLNLEEIAFMDFILQSFQHIFLWSAQFDIFVL